jgi:hypothetical protein
MKYGGRRKCISSKDLIWITLFAEVGVISAASVRGKRKILFGQFYGIIARLARIESVIIEQ